MCSSVAGSPSKCERCAAASTRRTARPGWSTRWPSRSHGSAPWFTAGPWPELGWQFGSEAAKPAQVITQAGIAECSWARVHLQKRTHLPGLATHPRARRIEPHPRPGRLNRARPAAPSPAWIFATSFGVAAGGSAVAWAPRPPASMGASVATRPTRPYSRGPALRHSYLLPDGEPDGDWASAGSLAGRGKRDRIRPGRKALAERRDRDDTRCSADNSLRDVAHDTAALA